MKLYGYWRSSSAWRVRIALNIKSLPWENVPVHLVRGGGEQFRPEFRAKNPVAQVPVLELEQGGEVVRISQSMAIIEYLEERFPTPALLPKEPLQRARARELAELVNSSIQPLQNRIVLERLSALGVDSQAWGREFIARGLDALEAHATVTAGRFLVGDEPTLADVYLVPQLYNARRFGLAVEKYPTLLGVEAGCQSLPAFQAAHPDKQPDAEPAPPT